MKEKQSTDQIADVTAEDVKCIKPGSIHSFPNLLKVFFVVILLIIISHGVFFLNQLNKYGESDNELKVLLVKSDYVYLYRKIIYFIYSKNNYEDGILDKIQYNLLDKILYSIKTKDNRYYLLKYKYIYYFYTNKLVKPYRNKDINYVLFDNIYSDIIEMSKINTKANIAYGDENKVISILCGYYIHYNYVHGINKNIQSIEVLTNNDYINKIKIIRDIIENNKSKNIDIMMLYSIIDIYEDLIHSNIIHGNFKCNDKINYRYMYYRKLLSNNNSNLRKSIELMTTYTGNAYAVSYILVNFCNIDKDKYYPDENIENQLRNNDMILQLIQKNSL